LAGLLTSHSQATKWAYQAVPVDDSRHYEFSAYLLADDGVTEAYLRVSWYPTPDASGPALSTSDSLTQAAGPTDGYVFQTTGAVQPPVGARSARVRVLLAPASATPASLAIDEVSFVVTNAPATATPSGTPAPSVTPPATAPASLPGAALASPVPDGRRPDAPAAGGGARADTAAEDSEEIDAPVALPTLIVEVAAARNAQSEASQPPALPETRFETPSQSDGGVPWAWLLGGALLVIGLGGALLQNRQSPR
jgi:hypothetical protein